MFVNYKLLNRISKFRGQAFIKRQIPPYEIQLCRYFNSKKIKLLRERETNGCLISFPLYNNIHCIRCGYKMSQLSGNVCWKCKEALKVKNFCCISCGALQHPNPEVNYFQLLGVSQLYEIDLEDLKKKFMKLQMAFHPDKFVNKSKEELEISQEYSSFINKAYETLKNPLQRGFYLLEIQKIPTDNLPLTQEFLIDMMEKNENLETIDSPKCLENFLKRNQESINEHLDLIKYAFRTNSLDQVTVNLSKLNYFIRLDNKIKEKLNKQSSDPS